MKKLATIIIVLLVTGLWLMSVERANAQTEIERIQKQISELESFAEVCSEVNDNLVPPGPTASAEDWRLYEFNLWNLEYCTTITERKLDGLRKRLGELLSRLPIIAPNEEPKTKKLREKIKEWEKGVAAAEAKRRKIRERLRKLRKVVKPKQPAPGFTVDNKSSDGLVTASFSTPYGKLRVKLPENRAAGDTLSGTVGAEPSGTTEADRANNLRQLESFVFEINGMPAKLSPSAKLLGTPPSQTLMSWDLIVTPRPSAVVTFVTLKDKDGVEKAECTLWRDQTNPPGAKTTGPKQFQFPATSQNGRPLEIVGPFDGNFKTTEIRIGGQPARLLAESASSCLVLAPDQNFGPTEITVKEGDVEAKGSCRNLGLRLDAPKTSLLKSETTVLTVTVEGLKGIQQNVPLLLEKQGVVSMEGGDTQTVQIRPTDVRADGTFELKRTLTGLQAGSFGVTATVIDPARRPIIIPLTENARVNGFRVKKDGDKFVIEVEGVQSPITGKPVDGEHKLEHQCPALSKVPYFGNLFLNRGIGRSTVDCLKLMVTARIIINEEEE